MIVQLRITATDYVNTEIPKQSNKEFNKSASERTTTNAFQSNFSSSKDATLSTKVI